MRASTLADAGFALSSCAGMGCWQLSCSALEAGLLHAWAAAETGRRASERAESDGGALVSSSSASCVTLTSATQSAAAPLTLTAAASSPSSAHAASCACAPCMRMLSTDADCLQCSRIQSNHESTGEPVLRSAIGALQPAAHRWPAAAPPSAPGPHGTAPAPPAARSPPPCASALNLVKKGSQEPLYSHASHAHMYSNVVTSMHALPCHI